MTVHVLGGGVAGIVAAFAARDRGRRVVLHEARSRLGGRAFASPDKVFGCDLDNGPHAMLGCYDEMLRLLARIGGLAQCRRDPALQMAYRHPGGAADRLRLSRLPAPVAMPWALAALRLPWRDKLAALRGMVTSLFGAPDHQTVAEWLAKHGQRGAPAAMLWRPLCCAVMNVEPELASAKVFLATLRQAFAGSARGAAFVLPIASWQQVLGAPAERALRDAGVEVCFGSRIEAIECDGDRVVALATTDRRIEVAADQTVLSALPWFALHKLRPECVPQPPLADSPIVSAFFAMDDAQAPPDEGPVVALVDGAPFHFLLRTPGAPRGRFALLSGGDRSMDGQPVATIEARARDQLARYFPEVDAARGEVRVRKEQLATFVAAPGTDTQRPAPGRVPGGPRNLLVCGDWTATGLPATLEGAARSAIAAVRGL